VDTCEAVFVLCDKAPADARQEDLQTVMACLAVGQYVQHREKARYRLAPKPLMQRLVDGCRQFLSYFHKVCWARCLEAGLCSSSVDPLSLQECMMHPIMLACC
jgi:hypothetical protein